MSRLCEKPSRTRRLDLSSRPSPRALLSTAGARFSGPPRRHPTPDVTRPLASPWHHRSYIVKELNKFGLAYIHMVSHRRAAVMTKPRQPARPIASVPSASGGRAPDGRAVPIDASGLLRRKQSGRAKDEAEAERSS